MAVGLVVLLLNAAWQYWPGKLYLVKSQGCPFAVFVLAMCVERI